MYVLYHKATRKVERVSISTVKEPGWEDVIPGLAHPELYDGFNTKDNEDLVFNKHAYEVRFKGDEPYLYYHKQIHMQCEADWAVAHGWQHQLCAGEDFLFTVKFVDEAGDPVSVSGELRVDSYNLYVSDSHMVIDDQEQVSFYIRSDKPCHTSVELHFYPTSHEFHGPDRGANEGRPFVRDRCRLNVVSIGTFRKYKKKAYYELIADKAAIPADNTSVANLTVIKRHANGNTDLSSKETVRLSTTRGRLSAESIQLTNGVGTFSLRSTEETVTATVVARSEGGQTIKDEVEIHFHV